MSLSPRSAFSLFVFLTLPCMSAFGDEPNKATLVKDSGDGARRVIRAEDEPTSFAGSVATMGNVADVAISPDGKIVVAGHGRAGGPGAFSVWDIEKLRPIASFQETRQASGISFSPDGKLVAYGTAGNLLRIRRMDTLDVLQELRGFQFRALETAFSPDGKWLVAAQQELVVFDTKTWKKVSLKFEKDEFISKPNWSFHGLDFSSDGSRLLAAGINRDRSDFFGRAIVWNTETGKIVCAKEHNQLIVAARFSPDGKRFATGDSQMQICDSSTGETLQVCNLRSTPVYDMAWSPNGRQVVAAGAVRGYAIFDTTNGQLTDLFDRPNDPQIRFNACRFSPDGSKIITGNSEAKVRVWDAKTLERLAEFPSSVDTNKSEQPVLAVARSADGRWIAAGREDTTVTIHNAKNGDLVKVLEGHDDVVAAVAFGPNGTLASAGYDESIKLWNVKTGEETRTLEGHDNWVFGIAFSPDGKTLASCGYDKTIRLWNVASGEETARFEGHYAAVRAVAFSPDGKRLASASSDRTVKIWDVASGKELLALKGHRGTVRSIGFSPDGKTLVSGSEDSTVRLWNAANGKEQRSMTGHDGMVWSVEFSPGGSNVVSAGFDRTLRVWDPKSGQLRQTLRGHADVVSSATFAADASAVISGSMDASIRIWRGTGRRAGNR